MLGSSMLSLNGHMMRSSKLLTQMHKAPCKMNSDKDVGPSGIIAEMLKGADDGVELERQLAEAVSVWFQ